MVLCSETRSLLLHSLLLLYFGEEKKVQEYAISKENIPRWYKLIGG